MNKSGWITRGGSERNMAIIVAAIRVAFAGLGASSVDALTGLFRRRSNGIGRIT